MHIEFEFKFSFCIFSHIILCPAVCIKPFFLEDFLNTKFRVLYNHKLFFHTLANLEHYSFIHLTLL